MSNSRFLKLSLASLERTNVTVIGLTAFFVSYTKSAGVTYFSAGAVACSLSVKVVKRFIRQPRPPHIPGRKVKVSYGMPSTHSASISYFAMYILLACIYLPIHPSFRPGLLFPILAPVITVPWAVIIMMSRIWLGHHTWPQVIAGASYGIIWAYIWFYLWTTGGLDNFGKEFEEIVDNWIA